MTYRDMTFCTRRECAVTHCLRHLSHVPEDCEIPVAVADFDAPWPCPLRAEHEARVSHVERGNNGP